MHGKRSRAEALGRSSPGHLRAGIPLSINETKLILSDRDGADLDPQLRERTCHIFALACAGTRRWGLFLYVIRLSKERPIVPTQALAVPPEAAVAISANVMSLSFADEVRMNSSCASKSLIAKAVLLASLRDPVRR